LGSDGWFFVALTVSDLKKVGAMIVGAAQELQLSGRKTPLVGGHDER
jgi:hypothetical protein